MSKRITFLTLAAGLMLPLAALSAPLSYTHADINYVNETFDGSGVDVDGDGFGVNIQAAFADNWFVDVNYSKTGLDGHAGPFSVHPDLERIGAGIGYSMTLAENTSAYGELNYQKIDIDFDDDKGLGAEIGLRYAIMPSFEVNGGIEYVDLTLNPSGTTIFDKEWGFKLGGVYDFTPSFGVTAGYEKIADLDGWKVGFRWYFGT